MFLDILLAALIISFSWLLFLSRFLPHNLWQGQLVRLTSGSLALETQLLPDPDFTTGFGPPGPGRLSVFGVYRGREERLAP